jgi:hypothetical protein
VDQYRSIVEQVSLDVKVAARAVDTNWDKMVEARQATYAAADSLDAIDQREQANVEPLTPTFINFFCYWLFQIPLAYTLAKKAYKL